jgi:hypothetical protein
MTTHARSSRPCWILAVTALLVAGCAAGPVPTRTPGAATAAPGVSAAPPSAGDPVCDRPTVEDARDFTDGVPDPAPPQASLAAAVAFHGRRLVGGVSDATGPLRAAVWDVTDLGAWRPVDSPSFEAASIADLAVLGDMLVGVGRHWGGSDPTATTGDAAAWVSDDGLGWTRVESPALALDDPYGGATLVEAGGPGLVAAGAEGMGESPRTVVWLSTDGRDWQRVSDQAAFASSTPSSLLARADGTLVLTLVTCGESGCFEGATLTSPDGLTWTRHEAPAGAAAPTIHQLAERQGSVLGAGTWYRTDAATGVSTGVQGGVWRWSDAGGWELIGGGPRPERTEGAGDYLGGPTLVADGDALFVTAHHGGSCGPGRTVVWTSADGTAWRRAWVSPDGVGLEIAAAGEGSVILVGTQTDSVSGATTPVAAVYIR